MAKKQYGMVIDLRRCIGCHACAIACKAEMLAPLGVWISHVKYLEKGPPPRLRRHFLPNHCNHCTDPPCVLAGDGALVKREDGVVLFTGEKKENLPTALMACPYHNISKDPVTGLYYKCTMCIHRVTKGIQPACVNVCPGRAKVFGDLTDPKSEASRLLKSFKASGLKEQDGTGPNNRYIGIRPVLKDFEKLIPGHRQWDPKELEKQMSFNA